jgi:uncharacterized repeat protein (TIGR04076 family)
MNKCPYTKNFTELDIIESIENKNCSFSKCHSNKNDLTSILKNHCPILLFIALPYYYTFSRGGWFPWIKNKKSVIVQCSALDPVIAEIKKEKNSEEIQASIIKKSNYCPFYNNQKIFSLSSIMKEICFYKLLHMLPFASHFSIFKTHSSIQCSCGFSNKPYQFTIKSRGRINLISSILNFFNNFKEIKIF